MFPILYLLLRNGPPRRRGGRRATPSALAMAPTRELALQVEMAAIITNRASLSA